MVIISMKETMTEMATLARGPRMNPAITTTASLGS